MENNNNILYTRKTRLRGNNGFIWTSDSHHNIKFTFPKNTWSDFLKCHKPASKMSNYLWYLIPLQWKIDGVGSFTFKSGASEVIFSGWAKSISTGRSSRMKPLKYKSRYSNCCSIIYTNLFLMQWNLDVTFSVICCSLSAHIWSWWWCWCFAGSDFACHGWQLSCEIDSHKY